MVQIFSLTFEKQYECFSACQHEILNLKYDLLIRILMMNLGR